MAGLGVPVLQTNLDDADVLERYLTNNEGKN